MSRSTACVDVLDASLHGSTPTVTPSDEIVDDWSASIDDLVALLILCVGQCNSQTVPALPPEEGGLLAASSRTVRSIVPENLAFNDHTARSGP